MGAMDDVMRDCCGACPKEPPKMASLPACERQDANAFVRGKLSWLVDDPGRQEIGSFHPITSGDWSAGAYLSDATPALFAAVVACAHAGCVDNNDDDVNGGGGVAVQLRSEVAAAAAKATAAAQLRSLLEAAAATAAATAAAERTAANANKDSNDDKDDNKNNDNDDDDDEEEEENFADSRDGLGRSLLYVAAQADAAAAATVLLEGGATLGATLFNGRTAVHAAAEAGHTATLEVLLRWHNAHSPPPETTATDAVGDGDNDDDDDEGGIEDEDEDGDGTNDDDSDGGASNVTLAAVSAPKHVRRVEHFRIDQPDRDLKLSALAMAAFYGHADCVELLVTVGGAAVDGVVLVADGRKSRNHEASTATLLQVAAVHGHVATMCKLLDLGAPVNQRDMTRETALHTAARGGDVAAVSLLLERGADAAAAAAFVTPMHAALKSVGDEDTCVEICSLLLQAGCPAHFTAAAEAASQAAPTGPPSRYNRGNSKAAVSGTAYTQPLHCAVSRGSLPLLRLFLNALPLAADESAASLAAVNAVHQGVGSNNSGFGFGRRNKAKATLMYTCVDRINAYLEQHGSADEEAPAAVAAVVSAETAAVVKALPAGSYKRWTTALRAARGVKLTTHSSESATQKLKAQRKQRLQEKARATPLWGETASSASVHVDDKGRELCGDSLWRHRRDDALAALALLVTTGGVCVHTDAFQPQWFEASPPLVDVLTTLRTEVAAVAAAQANDDRKLVEKAETEAQIEADAAAKTTTKSKFKMLFKGFQNGAGVSYSQRRAAETRTYHSSAHGGHGGEKIHAAACDKLFDAVHRGDVAAATALLTGDDNAVANDARVFVATAAVDGIRDTPLHIAARRRDTAMVALLVRSVQRSQTFCLVQFAVFVCLFCCCLL
jgi:ankyrin repeat protein